MELLDKIKIRLGISLQDDGFDPDLLAYIDDAFEELGVYVNASLTDAEKDYKTAIYFAQNYAIRAFNEQGLSQTGLARLDANCVGWKNSFATEKYNNDNKVTP